ncbi:MAG: DUF4097 family beta strand repeat protein [bacterium]|nr:DUF4097 family beta strand repeat protein [bacterium]
MKVLVTLGLLCGVISGLAAEFARDGDGWLYRDTVRFEEPVVNITTLSCEAVNGKVELTGEDRNSVVVIAYVEIRAEKLDEGEKYLKDFRPVVRRGGHEISVYGEYPKHSWSWDEMSANMDFVVSAPKDLKLDASCANGSITALNMRGDAELETANGEISFMSNESSMGRLVADCANGEVNVSVAELLGKCDLSTANGEVSMLVSKVLAANISLSCANGEIELVIPDDASVKISASSLTDGAIQTDWGNAEANGFSGSEIELTANGGKHSIDCSTVNGEISIRKYSSTAN